MILPARSLLSAIQFSRTQFSIRSFLRYALSRLSPELHVPIPESDGTKTEGYCNRVKSFVNVSFSGILSSNEYAMRVLEADLTPWSPPGTDIRMHSVKNVDEMYVWRDRSRAVPIRWNPSRMASNLSESVAALSATTEVFPNPIASLKCYRGLE